MTATEPGAEAGAGLDIKAWFGTKIGAVRDDLAGRIDAVNERLDTPPPAPVFFTAVANVIASAAGRGIMDLGGPPQGSFWIVHRIIVGGFQRDTTVEGIADVYVARSQSEVEAETIVALRDTSNLTTLPSVAFYGDEQITVQAEEHLWVMVQGATASEQMIGVAGVTQWREGNRKQAWAM